MTLFIYADELYKVNDKNEISRKCLDWKSSSKWLLNGAVTTNNFGSVVKHWSNEDIRAGLVPWQHKNGKAKSFICDIDHGTSRMWSRKITETRVIKD